MMSRLADRWFRSLTLLLVVSIVVSGATSATAQVHSRLEPRKRVEKRLKSFSDDNHIRENLIHKWFAESGCAKQNLSEQAAKFGLPPNVICVLPGETSDVIVVGAHTDKVMKAGDGVVDNWTGASLLPSLLFSLTAEKRHHTFIFVGFTAEERGMIGSAYYVDHLTPEQRAKIAAMVNMDSLGLSPTKVWASHSDKVLLDALASVALATKLPVSTVDVDKVGTTDSESFARYQIPRITLHSVTDDTITVLHSPKDTLSAVHMDDFYESYHLIAEYLAYLDGALTPLRAVEPGKATQ
jgi:hypothetical protein